MDFQKEQAWINVYWIVGLVMAGITFIIAATILPAAIIDGTIAVVCSCFIYKRHRWAGVVLLILQGFDKIVRIQTMMENPFALFFGLAAVYICIRGTIALFRVRKLIPEIKADVVK